MNDNYTQQWNVAEKRCVDGYTATNEIYINERLMFLGENQAAENKYMVAEFKFDNPFGAMETEFAGITNDYLEALSEFGKLVQYNIDVVQSERDVRKSLDGVEPLMLTNKHCTSNGLSEDLTGKLIIIKSEHLSPERCTAEYQLQICTGGFGAAPDSGGSAVFCNDLFYNKGQRFERRDILGVVDLKLLPEWAKSKFAVRRIDSGEHKNKPYFLAKIKDNKQKVEQNKAANINNPTKKKNRGGQEV